jgi:predicted TIM-barrel fold metal-dependent hydrolase
LASDLAPNYARRAFLSGTAALAASVALPAGAAALHRIDVHQHLIPPPYLKYNRAGIISGADVDPTPVLRWSPARMLAEMDRNGIAVAMLSMSSPGVSMLGGTRAQIRALARACNEYAATLRREHPSRLGHFAAMPLPDLNGALAEAAYALDILKSDGIGLYTSYNGTYLGDPAFRPLFAELNRRKAVVFVHPTQPQCCGSVLPGVEPSLLEYFFDTTRAITSLLFNGTFAAFPDVRFIFAQAGGAITALAPRIAAWGARQHRFAAAIPHGAFHELQKQYFDIASATNPLTMAALMHFAPASQIVFGSDAPYAPVVNTARGFDNTAMPAGTRAAIDRGNALRLFSRLRP